MRGLLQTDGNTGVDDDNLGFPWAGFGQWSNGGTGSNELRDNFGALDEISTISGGHLVQSAPMIG